MNLLIKRKFITSLIVSLLTFILLYIGIKIILENEIVTKNIIAFSIFSLILGIITLFFLYFKLKIAVFFFLLSIIIGFIEMYRTFFTMTIGWADLTGLLSLFLIIIIGLIVGVILQLGYFVYKRYIKH